jgi:hypothetical protein
VVKVSKQAADLAAEAAERDSRWDPLVEATTGWAQTTEDLADATADIDSLDEITLTQLGNDINEAQRQMQTECRKVRAAGGDVQNL